LLPALAAGQELVPLTGDFPINTSTSGSQLVNSLSSAPDGLGFVAVWRSEGQDGDAGGIFGRRFDHTGMALGPEFQVNSYTTGTQGAPVVAHTSDGGFLVVWADQEQRAVVGKHYDGAGMPRCCDFQAGRSLPSSNGATTAVSRAADGSSVLAWASLNLDGSILGVFGQRYDSAGTPLGPEFQVNTYTSSNQAFPSVSHLQDGGFVVVWNSIGSDGSNYGIAGQRFEADGSPRGAEFTVNTYTTGRQLRPEVSDTPHGGFVVVWHGESAASAGSDSASGRLYDSAGTALGPEFTVGAPGIYPNLGRSDGAGFLVTWTGLEQSGTDLGVFAQRYDAAGLPAGAAFRLNEQSEGHQLRSFVALLAGGDLIAAWSSTPIGVQDLEVNGRIFGPPNADLSVSVQTSPEPVTAGGSLVYLATVANEGPGAAPAARLTDALPAQLVFTSSLPGPPSCTHAAGLLSCDLGTIAPGAEVQVVVQAQVDPGASGDLQNTFEVRSDLLDRDPSDNTFASVTRVEGLTPTPTVPAEATATPTQSPQASATPTVLAEATPTSSPTDAATPAGTPTATPTPGQQPQAVPAGGPWVFLGIMLSAAWLGAGLPRRGVREGWPESG
jgi:uncharacterized repeat protein (TIGR01451 family)